ncbi:MAG TPA: hypothetical protein VHV57_17570 [Acidimicrobiales bacterium]|jgi:hypothetical protein|nr:hypothetical protein [Acidimicrobiales bacterium]
MAADDVVRVEQPEDIVAGMRLGRHVHHDPRSWNFQAERAAKVISVTHHSHGLPLNQKALGSCTANALCGAVNSARGAANKPPLTEHDAIKLYNTETVLEGKPHPPHDPGGSGLLVCKAAMQEKLITSYTHAFGVQQALEALVLRPVITGINWYTSFDKPGSDGLVTIEPKAKVRGGHEVLADGIDAEKELVWCWNSWGTVFALAGRFCMSFATWEQLLDRKNQGDVTVPIM